MDSDLMKKVDWKNVFSLFGVFALIAGIISIAYFAGNKNLETNSRAAGITSGTVNLSPTSVPQNFPLSYIYYDTQPNIGWTIHPYDTTTVVNFADTSTFYSGINSMNIQFGFSSFLDYPFIAINPPAYKNIGTFHMLQFYIKNNTPVQTIPVLIDFNEYSGQDAKAVSQYVDGGVIDTQWRKVLVPFGDFKLLQNATMFYNMFLEIRNNPAGWPAFNIDEMKLVCQGDANGDGVINIQDRQQYQLEFGSCTHNCKADFNNDGKVDIQDLNILNQKFGTTCS